MEVKAADLDDVGLLYWSMIWIEDIDIKLKRTVIRGYR
jgi:hypothetical protein